MFLFSYVSNIHLALHLLMYCLIYFPLVVGFLSLSLVCYALLCIHSSFAKHLEEEEKAGCFAFIALQISCYCRCSVALYHGALGWSALCDCGIS